MIKLKNKAKYFLNLEKRHHKQGNPQLKQGISELKQANESFITTDKEMLNQC